MHMEMEKEMRRAERRSTTARIIEKRSKKKIKVRDDEWKLNKQRIRKYEEQDFESELLMVVYE
jgi:hypothetical protein